MLKTESAVIVDTSDLDWWLEVAPTLEWTFAKTMSNHPHRYVVRGRHMRSEDFFRAVRVIRTFGEPGKFYSRTNIYLHRNGLKWWVMGKNIEDNGVINCAEIEGSDYGPQDAPSTATGQYTLYDGLSLAYDDRYTSDECARENAQVWKIIDRCTHSRLVPTLDVGCGTGLLLDLQLCTPQDYVGVDVSQGMLNELVLKHPSAKKLYPMTMEKALPQFAPKQFGLVAALFGAASYLEPDTIRSLPSLSQGPVVLMNYKEGYLPDYYEATGQTLPTAEPARKAAAELLDSHHGYVQKINNFDVTIIDPYWEGE